MDPNRQHDIGGFFGLELPVYDNFPQWHAGRSVPLNSGRAALEYILRSVGPIPRLWVPWYTCATVLEPVRRLGIPTQFYTVNENLEPDEFSLGGMGGEDWLLYTNYFGIKEQCVDKLAVLYRGRLIVDNALALYSPPRPGVPCFYSPRKFSGLPDGGIAVLDNPSLPLPERDLSSPWASFLLVREESGADAASALCDQSEERLHHAPMRRMSRLTERLIQSIDYGQARQRRMENFQFLHERLSPWNKLRIDLSSISAPFCYPFWTNLPDLRNELIDHRILIPLLWPEVLENAPPSGIEHRLALNLLPIPIDQRYSLTYVNYINSIITKF